MTEAEKDVVRIERLSMTCDEVAKLHGVTRQRISQIRHEHPDAAKRHLEASFGLGTYSDVLAASQSTA